MLNRQSLSFLGILFCAAPVHAACISPDQAEKHIGETKCVSGNVLRVDRGANGEHYLRFCADSHSCSFAAVIFSDDLRHIGDVNGLKGKFVEVHGDLKEYKGDPEIIVSEGWQLRGDAVSIPPLPKAYDVEKKGHYSAGILIHPKSYTTTSKRQTAKLPIEIPNDPEE